MEPDRKPKSEANAAADLLVEWLAKTFRKASNYTVAVTTGGDLVVSKVGGLSVGSRSKLTGPGQKILDHVKDNPDYKAYNVYLAGKFTNDTASNHAEMCILAACKRGGVAYIKCTSPNCAYCKATIAAYGITNGNAKGKGKSQIGWCHPYLQVNYGTARGTDVDAQLEELAKVSAMDASGVSVDDSLYKEGGLAQSPPSEGALTLISAKPKPREKSADEGEVKKSGARKTVKSPIFDRSTVSFDNKRMKERIINSPPQKSGGTSKVRGGVESKAEVGSDSEDDSAEISGTSPEKAEVDPGKEKTKVTTSKKKPEVKQSPRRSARLRKRTLPRAKTRG
ncbi:hypothetical protein [Nonomuraea sp. NEAU-A123]|uniref:hypothetical protein n=1 Tax=Nonomuraea sp. NEAU-A123 TaxID=2839649 RepID=UPI001BE46E07|nr:hypothetical protein [Nonomuraea sp. NEAU-A123]MBT2226105.1 hypothetical protein [Nonomuraea sp. NEAU-A123]